MRSYGELFLLRLQTLTLTLTLIVRAFASFSLASFNYEHVCSIQSEAVSYLVLLHGKTRAQISKIERSCGFQESFRLFGGNVQALR